MKQSELFSYVYDFISQLMEKEEIFQRMDRIILFGSVARGDFTSKSDVDLFIECKEQEKIRPIIKSELNKFEVRAEKVWYLRGISLPIKVIVSGQGEKRWEALHEEIVSEGKVVFGTLQESPKNLSHHLLVTYELSRLDQHKKMAFLRSIYGYKNKKGEKMYSQPGLLSKLQGKRVGINAFLLPRQEWLSLKKAMAIQKVPYTIKDAWLKQ